MAPYNTVSHDNEYVNKNSQGYSPMSNPNCGQPPMYKETSITYAPYPYQPEMPINGPKYGMGWSKDFVKQCTVPIHEQYGCPPGMPYNCTFDYPMNKDIKWQVPTPVPTPMPVPVPVPVAVPMPLPTQWQHQQPQPQLQQSPLSIWQWQQQQGQWPVQWPVQWQNQWQQDLPYPQQWTKDMKFPVPLPIHQQQQQYPIGHDQSIQWNHFQPQPIHFNQPLPMPMPPKFPIGHDQPIHFNQPQPQQMPMPFPQPHPQPMIHGPMHQGPMGQRQTQVTTTKW